MTPPTSRPTAAPRPFALAAAAGVLAASLTSLPAAAELRTVVVTSVDGAAAAAEAVAAAGGTVLSRLELVGGVVARIDRSREAGRGTVTVDDITLRAASSGTPTDTARASVRSTLGLAAADPDGAGIGVAVVDTGIADVPGLAGRVIDRVNTSGGPAGDGYGHGTFIAGLVAGEDVGVAPAAHLLDVKVADATGSTSLSQVLLGLQAVAERADALDIRVVNLSLSSGSPLPPALDPLGRALEALWRQGLVVVVAAGNEGPRAGTVTSPGTHPTVVTLGALDEGAGAGRADDTVPSWSSRGPAPAGVAKPELVAPGTSVVSLRAPGSVIDEMSPAARVGDARFSGSGTSMAAAVASGAVAALLSDRPTLTPDSVKSVLVSTAYSAPGLARPTEAGAGGLDVGAALAAAAGAPQSPPGRRSGSDQIQTLVRAWGSDEWPGRAWADEEWPGRAWAGRAWAGRAWAGRAWASTDWLGAHLTDDEWLARAWSARAWSARAWSARAWSARAWG